MLTTAGLVSWAREQATQLEADDLPADRVRLRMVVVEGDKPCCQVEDPSESLRSARLP